MLRGLRESSCMRALRFVYNDNASSYANLLAKANLPTLELGRLRKIAIEVYKSVKGVSPTYICDMFKIKNTNYNLRNSSLLVKNHQRTKAFGLSSFSYTASHIWNLLPQQLRNAQNLKEFGKLVKTWEGPKCKCNFCIML